MDKTLHFIIFGHLFWTEFALGPATERNRHRLRNDVSRVGPEAVPLHCVGDDGYPVPSSPPSWGDVWTGVVHERSGQDPVQ